MDFGCAVFGVENQRYLATFHDVERLDGGAQTRNLSVAAGAFDSDFAARVEAKSLQ